MFSLVGRLVMIIRYCACMCRCQMCMCKGMCTMIVLANKSDSMQMIKFHCKLLMNVVCEFVTSVVTGDSQAIHE